MPPRSCYKAPSGISDGVQRSNQWGGRFLLWTRMTEAGAQRLGSVIAGTGHLGSLTGRVQTRTAHGETTRINQQHLKFRRTADGPQQPGGTKSDTAAQVERESSAGNTDAELVHQWLEA